MIQIRSRGAPAYKSRRRELEPDGARFERSAAEAASGEELQKGHGGEGAAEERRVCGWFFDDDHDEFYL
jgi:hypothetical protein